MCVCNTRRYSTSECRGKESGMASGSELVDVFIVGGGGGGSLGLALAGDWRRGRRGEEGEEGEGK